MKKEEIVILINNLSQSFPEKVTGNEANPIIAEKLKSVVSADRIALVEVLRDWISVRIPQSERKPGDGIREGRLWLALEVCRKYSLKELHSDINALIVDVRCGKTYLPYYEDMIAKYLQQL